MPVFDQGYHHWRGERAGLGLRWWAITRHGVRAGLRQRLTQLICLLGFVPAIILTIVLALWGLAEQQSGPMGWFLRLFPDFIQADPKAFRPVVWTIGYQFFFAAQLLYCMLLIVVVGPRLISQDLRFNAIPLYLSRPLRRIDYFLGKWGVIATFIATVAIAPAMFAWACGVAFSLDVTTLRDTWRIALGALGYGAVITVSAGTLMLAMSSLSRRSGYVVILWFGFWLLTSAVAGTMTTIAVVEQESQARAARKAATPGVESTPARTAPETSWYPLISYTANLERLGNGMLGTRAAWQKVQDVVERTTRQAPAMRGMQRGGGQPSQADSPQLVRLAGVGTPWYWSAAVLVGLFGLSVVVLRSRVRTLDRLK